MIKPKVELIDDYFFAYYPELGKCACSATADTEKEAIEDLKKVLRDVRPILINTFIMDLEKQISSLKEIATTLHVLRAPGNWAEDRQSIRKHFDIILEDINAFRKRPDFWEEEDDD